MPRPSRSTRSKFTAIVIATAATIAGIGGATSLLARQAGQPGQGPRAADPAQQAPGQVQLDGELEVRYEDSNTGARLRHFLKTSSERIELSIPGEPPGLQSGTRVRVHGQPQNNMLALASRGSVEVLALAASNTFGAQRTIVILVNLQDNVQQPYTPDFASSTTFQSTSDFYRENSYGQTWLVGDVFGWFTIAMNSTTCDSDQIATLADQAATKAGANLANYTHRVYAFPRIASCGWWGLGTLGGNPSRAWVNGTYALKVVGHEMGHNLGDYHSKSLPCDPAACSVVEYGDDHDIMGNPSSGHFNAFQKERLGWLNYGSSPPIANVTTSGNYFVEAMSLSGTGAKALRILKSIDASGQRTWYYIESRASAGFDNGIAPGVLVHTGSEATGDSSNLVDLDPFSSSFDAVLDVGQSFSDAAAGLQIQTISADGTGALVSVSYDGSSVCAVRAPTVSMSPPSASAAPGAAVPYTVTVKNNDVSGCPNATFDLSSVVPAGWNSVFATTSIDLAPGASSAIGLTITSAASAAGSYTLQASANRSGPVASATASISIVGPLSVSLSATASNGTYQLSARVLSGASPISGARVTFTLTDPDNQVTTLSATTNSTGTAVAKYRVKRNDPIGGYQVTAVATFSGASGSATGGFTVK